MKKFTKTSTFPVPVSELFAWHEREGAFERLNPPWDPVRIVKKDAGIQDGAEVTISVSPVGIKWTLRHSDYQKNRCFSDVQVKGPFKSWKHDHLFREVSANSSELSDVISYETPFGIADCIIEKKLQALFNYRHALMQSDIARHQGKKKIIVTGSSGMVGTALVAFLRTGGHKVLRAVRSSPENNKEIYWNPESPSGERKAPWEGADAVVHLAGAPIFGRRWDEKQKQLIKQSRMRGTENLCRLLTSLAEPPKTLISMSGVNYYGTSSDDLLTDDSPAGDGFLAEVSQGWEAATHQADLAGIRVVNLRLGVVLSPTGGALAKMLPPFKLGVGGPVGSGKQHMSWISLRDVVYMINHSIHQDELSGPINGVALAPSTNREFSKTLGRVLHRPAILPVPPAALKLALGDVAEETVLADLPVAPSEKVLKSGFEYADPDLEGALSHCLGYE